MAEVRDKALDVLGRSPTERPPAHHRRVRVRHDRAARAAARRDDARHPPAAGGRAGAAAPPPPPGGPLSARAALVPAGPFTMGTSTEPWALDNERPAHVVDVPAFRIATAPVTNGEYAAFVDAGGYRDPRWWTEAGWRHRTEAGLVAPAFWARDADGTWWRRRFGVVEPVPLDQPVCTCARTRPTPTPRWVGRGCPPRPSGRRRRATTRHRHHPPLPLGRRRPHAPRTPTSVSATSRPPRSGPTRRARRRWASSSSSATCGSGRPRAGALPGVRGVPVPRVLRGVLRRRLPRAARRIVRHRPGRRPRHVPQLGPPGPPPDLRGVPARLAADV